jgi:hypothetical protein
MDDYIIIPILAITTIAVITIIIIIMASMGCLELAPMRPFVPIKGRPVAYPERSRSSRWLGYSSGYGVCPSLLEWVCWLLSVGRMNDDR